MIRKIPQLDSFTRRLLATLTVGAVVAWSGATLRAQDVVYSTAYIGTALNLCGTGPCLNPLGLTPTPAVSTFGATEISTAPGVPSRSKSIYGHTNAATGTAIVNWSITPTLNVAGAVYKIETAHNTDTSATRSCSTNVTVTVFSADGTVSAECTNSPAFQRAYGGPVWNLIGYITNNPGVTAPVIIFYQSGGRVSNGASPDNNRLYIDAFKFTEVNPCLGVSGDVAITGPLAANNTFVNVTGVTAGATNVTVYANDIEIGQTNYAAGFAAGSLAVPTSALVQNEVIKARQTKNGCISSMPSSGPGVGAGANSQLKISLGLAQNAAFTGPAGADSSGAATVNYWLKASGLTGGSATAPTGGQVLPPGACWQTATFNWDSDSGLNWLSGASVVDNNPFAALDNLTFAIETDNGPFDIYVDEIKNGDVVIENFEGYDNGTPNVTFQNPNYPATPSVGATYLSAPNSTAISQNHAFEGTNACRIQWQFANELNIRWARVVAAGLSAGKKYPQLDTSKPVTVRVLVLPVGTSVDQKFNGTASNITNTSPVYAGTTNTLGVTVTGPGTYTYQWSWNGGSLPNPTTDRTYMIDGAGAGVSIADDGVYTVDISDGTCSETRSILLAVANPLPLITNQPVSKTIAHVGDTATFSVGATAPSAAGFPLSYVWRFNGNDIAGATDSSFTTNNVQVADAGYYTAVVVNSYGSATSAVATLDVVQPAVVIGSGTGLRGNYYSPAYSTNPFAGPITLTRIDPVVDFNWGSGVTGYPDPSLAADYFAVRWLGQVRALDTDTYTFYVKSDDGQRLWVNGQLLVNDWVPHGATERSNTIALVANQHYDVVMEYFEGAVAASSQLSWSTAGGGVPKEVIPTSQLYPASTTITSPTLSFGMDGGTNLVFNWGPGTYTLVWATNVTGPYTNRINGVTSPYTNIIGSEPAKFFRLQLLQ